MFIQIIQGRCTHEAEMRALLDRWASEIGPTAPGWLGGTYGFTDDGELVAVVRFESREDAMANSKRPEQGSWWSEVERLFDGPVTFHDAERVMLMMDGGSDDAGFVQIIQGRIDDPDAIEAGLRETETLLHEARPDIIGGTLAIEPDGTFTETIAFTDEAAAREGESQAMPSQGRAAEVLRDWDAHVHAERFLDLHKPFFNSRH